MGEKLGLLHHRHTGKVVPHHHTSYAALTFIMMLVGILLAGTSWVSLDASPPPQASSVSLSGTMPSKPPKNAPTITSPANGTATATAPVTIGGTCGDGTIIQLFDNGIFAGSTPCDDKGKFSIQVGLLYGSNVFIARGYDGLDQASPDSNSLFVNYTAQPPKPLALDSQNHLPNQLLLRTDAIIRGLDPGETLNMPLEFIGGSAPFSVNVDWGEGQPQLIARPTSASFQLTHVYNRPGTYQVTIRASDVNGQSAILSVVVVVNGASNNVAAGTTSGPTGSPTNTTVSRLLIAWPLYLLGLVAIVSFWLGEATEKHHLTKLAA